MKKGRNRSLFDLYMIIVHKIQFLDYNSREFYKQPSIKVFPARPNSYLNRLEDRGLGRVNFNRYLLFQSSLFYFFLN